MIPVNHYTIWPPISKTISIKHCRVEIIACSFVLFNKYRFFNFYCFFRQRFPAAYLLKLFLLPQRVHTTLCALLLLHHDLYKSLHYCFCITIYKKILNLTKTEHCRMGQSRNISPRGSLDCLKGDGQRLININTGDRILYGEKAKIWCVGIFSFILISCDISSANSSSLTVSSSFLCAPTRWWLMPLPRVFLTSIHR